VPHSAFPKLHGLDRRYNDFPQISYYVKNPKLLQVIFFALHGISRKQPPAHLSVILRYEAASLEIWFPTFREKVVILPSRVGISETNVTPLDVAEEHYLADTAGKT
jgi:hypothetical protein